jgi:hypothetical protein
MAEKIRVPIELLEQFERSNVLLFVGEGINQGILPSSKELAQGLAARCDYPPEEPLELPRVAGYYEMTRQDRQGLIQFLRDQLDQPALLPQRAHRLVAQLRPRVIVTTCLDRLLERALREASILYTSVVGNAEVAYAEGDKVLLVWPWGVLDQPESIVVTEDDRRHFLESRANLSDILRGELARRTWLFVGFDAEDGWFRSFYSGVSRSLDRQNRRAYILGAPNAYARAWWEKHNADILTAEIEAFLSALTERLAASARGQGGSWRRGAVTPGPLPEEPYKALAPYHAEDRGLFFGRGREIEELTALIHAHRLALLYGGSGVGKTSLLQAGVIPRLEQANQGYTVVNVRTLADPIAAVQASLRRKLPDAEWPADEKASLVDFVAAAIRAGERPLALVIDQFEDFFTSLDSEALIQFIGQLGALYDAHDLPVKVAISLREDYLARVSELEERIPEIFTTRMRLLPLTLEQAQDAIIQPAKAMGYAYEPELVKRLLGDLMRDGVVVPFQLQLVCNALFHRARAGGRRTLATADYEGIGGWQGVLQNYLDEELRLFSPKHRKLAREVMGEMVTSERARKVEPHSRLLAALNIDENSLNEVLAKLVQARLVHPVEDVETSEIAYEVAHDYLAEEIAAQFDEEQLKVKQARELLHRAMDNWKHARLRIPPDVLRLIHECREKLRQLSTSELELLFRSALKHSYETEYWYRRASQGGADVDEIARREGLESADFRVRATAVTTLGELGERFVAPIVERLTDDFPQVRVAALQALERLRQDGEWRKQLRHERYVSAGKFVLGDDDSDENDDKPAREIYVDAFYVSRYLLTNAEYKRYADDVGQDFDMPKDKENHPVTGISWEDALNYANWAEMRLLTEAEWEKAASWDDEAGRKRKYPWGDQFDGSRCNTVEAGACDTTPVGYYSPEGDSPYGCADMAGNVWEWTGSLYAGYACRASDSQVDLSGSGSRVVRGGSFYTDRGLACTTYRRGNAPNSRGKNIGVRLGIKVPDLLL